MNTDCLTSELNNKTILITGATGLIGKALIEWISREVQTCKIVAVVRSMDKANKSFTKKDNITFIEADVNNPIVVDYPIDYIVHSASITSSKAFVDTPVDTIMTAVNGTKNFLDLARDKKVKSFVYLSTMEVYGTPTTDDKITEDASCNLDTMKVRSSYPESKRLCENMCIAYYSQYGVPAKVVRLTQTIGPGIDYNDGRVFAEFARCAIENRDIVLRTKGLTKRSYLSSEDAVTAILTALINGANGEAYNAANEDTYCSIYDMAHMVADEICGGKIKVIIDEDSISKYGYLPEMKMNLDTGKLNGLGWDSEDGLEEMYFQLINYMPGLQNE